MDLAAGRDHANGSTAQRARILLMRDEIDGRDGLVCLLHKVEVHKPLVLSAQESSTMPQLSFPRPSAVPTCPHCQQPMLATERIPTPSHGIAGKTKLRVGSPALPRKPLAIWRCEPCNIDRARFD